MTNAPPPLLPTIYGKRQMLPSPIADPAAAKIKPLVEEAGFTVEIINLPDDVDPGIMSVEDIESIIEYTK